MFPVVSSIVSIFVVNKSHKTTIPPFTHTDSNTGDVTGCHSLWIDPWKHAGTTHHYSKTQNSSSCVTWGSWQTFNLMQIRCRTNSLETTKRTCFDLLVTEEHSCFLLHSTMWKNFKENGGKADTVASAILYDGTGASRGLDKIKTMRGKHLARNWSASLCTSLVATKENNCSVGEQYVNYVLITNMPASFRLMIVTRDYLPVCIYNIKHLELRVSDTWVSTYTPKCSLTLCLPCMFRFVFTRNCPSGAKASQPG